MCLDHTKRTGEVSHNEFYLGPTQGDPMLNVIPLAQGMTSPHASSASVGASEGSEIKSERRAVNNIIRISRLHEKRW